MSKLTKTFFKTNPEGVWLSVDLERDTEGLVFIPKGVIDWLDEAIRKVVAPFKLNDTVDSSGYSINLISHQLKFEIRPDQIFTHIVGGGKVVGCYISLEYFNFSTRHCETVEVDYERSRFNHETLSFGLSREWKELNIEDEFPDMED